MLKPRRLCFLQMFAVAWTVAAQTPQDIVREFQASLDWVQAEAALEKLPGPFYVEFWSGGKAVESLQPTLREGFTRMLFTRWAQADVKGALAAAADCALADHRLHEAMLEGVARGAWTAEQAMLEALGEWRARPELLAEFMPVLAGQIPGSSVEQAYARLKKIAPLAGGQDIVREMVMDVAQAMAAFPDTEEAWRRALAFAQGLPASEFQRRLQALLWLNPPGSIPHHVLWEAALELGTPPQERGWVLARWFQADREAAWKALLTLPPDAQPAATAESLAGNVATQVPDSAAWLLQREDGPGWSPRGMGVLLRYSLEHETVSALAWLRENKARVPEEAWKYAHDFHSEKPDFARLWLELHCDTPKAIEKGWFGGALKTLGRDAPEDAVAWIDTHLSGDKRDYYLSEQIRLWGAERPQEALAVMQRLREVNARDAARAELFRSWAPKDFSAALSKARTFQGEERLRAICDVVQGGARDHLEAAAEAFLNLLKETEAPAAAESWSAGFAADELFKAMSAARGKAAVDWLRSQVPEAHQASLAKRLYHALSRTMVGEMDDFIAGMPDDGIRQAWLVERVQYGYQNPPRSLRLARDIRDPGQRREACLQVMQAWKNLDPVYARHALPGLPLPEEDKEELRALLERP